MEITPATSAATPKTRTSKVRAAAEAEPTKSAATKKAKPAVKTTVIASPPASKPKKADSPRKLTAKTKVTAPAKSVKVTQPSIEELGGMIAQAAYYIAAQRNFAPGNELDDWLNAEREILSRYAQ